MWTKRFGNDVQMTKRNRMEVLNGCVPIIDTGELNFILTLSGKGTWKATGAAQKRANLHD
jgi:hypothetical protein